ncbi:hypothetical protein HCN08_24465 [Streptomyces sp. PRB2-1]|uniref:Tetracyclin repressor-like C-terminal domain-containing protein n=1 Tax=Actinacidiphila epipremni TaxID=2053013 RepID=A0ABX0ZRE2_9ACTN|nr:hypothetical protein [Actinacidiphila epipremni]
MAAEAVGDDAFARTVWERLITPRRDVVRSLLIRARERGEVGYGDEDFLIDLVYGPMWYRLLLTPTSPRRSRPLRRPAEATVHLAAGFTWPAARLPGGSFLRRLSCPLPPGPRRCRRPTRARRAGT